MHHHPLVLVVKDLWYFVTSEVRYLLPLPHKTYLLSQRQQSQLTASTSLSPLLLTSGSDTSYEKIEIEDSDLEVLYQPELDYLEYESLQPESSDSFLSTQNFESYNPAVMYVAVEQAICVVRPYRDFDTVLAKFPYGTAVTVTGFQGSYAKVFWSHHEGWIQKDDLTPHKAEVWPHFTNGNTYESTDDVVKKLRLLIGDTFCASELALPLQAGEWVVYRLREQNRIIPWPVSHGRVPGDWQVLLKGVPGIHISITPKTDSIMEWRGDDGIGRVAYVEKVGVDQTLTLTLVGYESPGLYEERVLTEVEWRELRPVFIEVL
ncbi:MAG: hypothetical protein ACK42D_03385 [Candidatus Paceibacteria bacterium]